MPVSFFYFNATFEGHKSLWKMQSGIKKDERVICVIGEKADNNGEQNGNYDKRND